MNIKNTLKTYLSFGEKLKIKDSDNYGFDAMRKLTFGASAVKSSLINKDAKSILLSALINTAPFAILSVLVLAIIYALNGMVLTTLNNFCAGFICFFIYILIELFKSNYNNFKEQNLLKSSLIVASATFILSCGTVIREIYNILTKKYWQGKIFDISAIVIIFAVVFFAVLTKGEFKKNLNTLLASVISVLYLATNATYFKAFSFMSYVRIGLVLVMLGLMVYTIIKENKGLKLNLKTPLIILGATIVLTVAIALVIRFAYKDINQIKYILSSAFAGLFGGDINSLALVENTLGGGIITNNTSLLGLISTIAYILPGSYLINTVTMAGFNMGFKGESALALGSLYAIMGLVIVIGLSLSAFSLVIEFVKSGKDLTRLTAIKNYVSACIMGLIPVTVLAMISTFVNLVRVSFNGVAGILFAAVLVAVIYIACNKYKLNRNIAAIVSGVLTTLIMIFSAGIILY